MISPSWTKLSDLTNAPAGIQTPSRLSQLGPTSTIPCVLTAEHKLSSATDLQHGPREPWHLCAPAPSLFPPQAANCGFHVCKQERESCGANPLGLGQSF